MYSTVLTNDNDLKIAIFLFLSLFRKNFKFIISKMSSEGRNFVHFLVAECLSIGGVDSQTYGKLASFFGKHEHYGQYKPIMFHPAKPGNRLVKLLIFNYNTL